MFLNQFYEGIEVRGRRPESGVLGERSLYRKCSSYEARYKWIIRNISIHRQRNNIIFCRASFDNCTVVITIMNKFGQNGQDRFLVSNRWYEIIFVPHTENRPFSKN